MFKNVTNSAVKAEVSSGNYQIPILLDYVDLARMLRVDKRTLYNWRAKGLINLMSIGGRGLYMTQQMFQSFMKEKGGNL